MKILFVSYFFPPVKAVASVRTWNLCKGLLTAGHSVQVVTVDDNDMPKRRLEPHHDWDECKALSAYSELRVPSPWPSLYGKQSALLGGMVRRCVTRWFVRIVSKLTIWFGFDPMLPWALSVWRHVRDIKDVDLVLVSGGPFSSFLPGFLLSRKLQCPLVLDYRDVWNNSPHVGFRLSTRPMERLFLRHSRLVTTVSPSCLASILGSEVRSSAVVTNGVSSDVYGYRSNHLRPPTPVIVYAGAFYPPKRSIEPFFEAFSKFRENCDESLSFIYLGSSVDYVTETARTYGLSDVVDCRGMVTHDESLQIQSMSLCTLVVTSVDEWASIADRGILTGKLFEAIELARNVMIICPTNSDAISLTENFSHVGHFTGAQVESMVVWLESIIDSPDKIEPCLSKNFSWEKLSQQYVELCERCVEHN